MLIMDPSVARGTCGTHVISNKFDPIGSTTYGSSLVRMVLLRMTRNSKIKWNQCETDISMSSVTPLFGATMLNFWCNSVVRCL